MNQREANLVSCRHGVRSGWRCSQPDLMLGGDHELNRSSGSAYHQFITGASRSWRVSGMEWWTRWWELKMKHGGLSEKMWLHDDPQTNWCSTDLLATKAQANQLGLPAIETCDFTMGGWRLFEISPIWFVGAMRLGFLGLHFTKSAGFRVVVEVNTHRTSDSTAKTTREHATQRRGPMMQWRYRSSGSGSSSDRAQKGHRLLPFQTTRLRSSGRKH